MSDITGNNNFGLAEYTYLDQLTKSLLLEKNKIKNFYQDVYKPSKNYINQILSNYFIPSTNFNSILSNINSNLEDYLPNLEKTVDNNTGDFLKSLQYIIEDNPIDIPILLNNYITDTTSTELPKSFFTSCSSSIILATVNNMVKKSESNELLISSIIYGIIYNIGLRQLLQSIINITKIMDVINNKFSHITNVEILYNTFNDIITMLQNMHISYSAILDVEEFLREYEEFTEDDIQNIKNGITPIQILTNYVTSQITALVPNISGLSLCSNLNAGENKNILNPFGGSLNIDDPDFFILETNNLINEIQTQIIDDLGTF